jgi:hypothetical protein
MIIITLQRKSPLSRLIKGFLIENNHGLVVELSLCTNPTKFSVIEIMNASIISLLIVHHKWTITFNRLIQRLASQHQKFGILLGFSSKSISLIKNDH